MTDAPAEVGLESFRRVVRLARAAVRVRYAAAVISGHVVVDGPEELCPAATVRRLLALAGPGGTEPSTGASPVAVTNLATDQRTAALSAAAQRRGHPLRGAWAAVAVSDRHGGHVGHLCVLDPEPRGWSADELDHLVSAAACLGVEATPTAGPTPGQARAERAGTTGEVTSAALEATLDGVVVVSATGELLHGNARFAELWGFPPAIVSSGSDDAALAWAAEQVEDPGLFLHRVRHLYAARAAARDELRLRSGRVLDRYGSPLFAADGRYLGYAWYFRDVSAERAATAALATSEARHRSLVQALASEVWAVDASGSLISDMPKWRRVTGQTEDELLGWGWADAIHPDDRPHALAAWTEALRTGSPYRTEYRIRPVTLPPEEADQHCRTLDVRGVPVGPDDEAPEWIGVFTDVTDLREAEAARERLAIVAGAAAERTRMLQQVTASLSRAVTTADVMSAILEAAETELHAVASGIAMRDGRDVTYHVLKGYSDDVRSQWQTFDVDVESPVPHVLRTGEPLFLGSPEVVLTRFPALREFLERSGERALARLPLTTPSGTFGVLTLGFATDRDFPEDERDLLVALARQCAQALERTELYERVRDTALVLQRSLLPDSLPAAPGLELAARYQPATAGVEVGGDWYDALVLPDGRLAVAVGDVIGKGVRAASVMGQVRNALRGLVHPDPAPSVVLGWLDALVRHLGGDEEFVTLVYAVVDPADGGVVWAAAGHPPPVVVRGAEATLADDVGSVPLGLGPDGHREGRLTLRPGDALLLYSDGLVESRARPLLEGLPALVEVTSGAVREDPSPSGICDLVLERMGEDRQEDDVTLLVVRRAVAVLDGDDDVLVLTPEPASVAAARAFVAGRLAAGGATAATTDVAALCVSELVTNAVVHAGTEIEVRVTERPGAFHVEVRDRRRATVLVGQPPAGPDDTHGRGLFLVESLAAEWGITDEVAGKVVWFDVADEDAD